MNKLIAIIVLSCTLPRLVYRIVSAVYQQQSIDCVTTNFIGRNRKPFKSTTFKINNQVISRFDHWLNVLRGNLTLIGPKPITQKKAKTLNTQAATRFAVKPGLITPFMVKKMAGIAHQGETTISSKFAQSSSFMRGAQIMFIFVLLKLLGKNKSTLAFNKKFTLFGINISNVTMQQAVSNIAENLTQKRRNKLAFVNADCVNQYYSNNDYKQTLQKFDHIFADGIGIKIAAHMHRERISENVNGTDMFPLLCKQLEKSGHNIYFLGAEPTVIKKMVHLTKQSYPKLNIAGYCDGFTYHHNPKQLINKINRSHADILLIGMGAPIQEQWIEAHFDSLNCTIAMGVGGLFDFYSENIQRAPIWVRELSIEWVWRLLMQPISKGKRYLIGNPLFLYRVFISSRKHNKKAKQAAIIAC